MVIYYNDGTSHELIPAVILPPWMFMNLKHEN